MIATCDNCKTAFNVNDSLIKKEGIKVRCANCKHVFKIMPPKPEPLLQDSGQQQPLQASPPPPVQTEKPTIVAAKKNLPEIKKPEFNPDQGFSGESTITIVDFSKDVFSPTEEVKERYVDLGSIGKGGMGEVLLAKDTQLLRKVAIKVLREDCATPATLMYFLREAQITAQLDHPNIVPLYTVKQPDADEKNVSFVMKLIKGKDLHEITSAARAMYLENPKAKVPAEISMRSRLEHFIKACDGITYAHRKQVVHRDLKPANIMVGDYGEVYVMDWGIAKMLQADPEDNLTNVNQHTEIFVGDFGRDETRASNQPEGVVGTLSYMSPEQANADPEVGPASDIYSLGAVLYELVTLRPPRTGEASKKLQWAQGGFINRLTHLAPDKKIDPELKAIIHRATEVEPQDRYVNATALAADVRAYLRGDEVSELPDNLPRKVWRWMNKHRLLSLTVVLSVLLISAAITIGSLYQQKTALAESQIRERRFSNLQAHVALQAHTIDTNFVRLEDLAMGLAKNATYMIENGPPNDEMFYWISDFKNSEAAPPDLNYSSLYQKHVSIGYPVVKPAPGIIKEDVAEMMQSLAPLRHHFKQMLLSSRNSLSPLSEEEANRLLTVHGLPIRWAFIGLEAGVMYSYPGKGSYSDEYDPRVRPWYELGANKNAVYWGNAYVDLQGQGLVLPCATSLYDKNNQFIGVLGMDITFSEIIRNNLTRDESDGVLDSYLLDDKGRIVVSKEQIYMKATEQAAIGATIGLKAFPVEDVVKSIQNGESGGLLEIMEKGESRLIVYNLMSSINWYYVEKVDTHKIME